MNDDLKQMQQRILHSPSYRLAEEDIELLQTPALRPIRMQLELLKCEIAFQQNGIASTIVVFGGTQLVEPQEAEERLREARKQLQLEPDNRQFQQRSPAPSEFWRSHRIMMKRASSRGSCHTHVRQRENVNTS